MFQFSAEDLHFVTRVQYSVSQGDGEWGENEIDYIVIGQRNEAEIALDAVNKNEVIDVKYVDEDGLKEMIGEWLIHWMIVLLIDNDWLIDVLFIEVIKWGWGQIEVVDWLIEVIQWLIEVFVWLGTGVIQWLNEVMQWLIYEWLIDDDVTKWLIGLLDLIDWLQDRGTWLIDWSCDEYNNANMINIFSQSHPRAATAHPVDYAHDQERTALQLVETSAQSAGCIWSQHHT